MDRVYYVFLTTFSSFYSRLLFNRNFYINSTQRQFLLSFDTLHVISHFPIFSRRWISYVMSTLSTPFSPLITPTIFICSKMSGVKIQTNSTLPQQLDWVSRRRNQIAAVILPSVYGLGRYWHCYYNIGRY
jgi:hypothetical protein